MQKYVVQSVKHSSKYLELSLAPTNPSKRLEFLPGQYATVSFKRNGKWSPARCFSFTNSPREEVLSFGMRPGGKFTGPVAELEPGTPVRIQGPFGNFTIDPSYDEKIVMLASGIGITPFISMLRHARETNLSNPITLVYSCSTDHDIPFYEEIMELDQAMPKLRVFILVGHGTPGLNRRIFIRRLNMELVSSLIEGKFSDYSFFICGSKKFNDRLEKDLKAQSVDNDRIVTESFTQATTLAGFRNLNLTIPSLTYMATGTAILLGFFFFMVVDLSRYVPKAQAAVRSTSTPSTSPTDNQSNDTTTSPNTNSSPSQPTSNSSSQSYSAPVSSVS